MQAIQIQSHGGPEVLKLSTLPDPEPAEGCPDAVDRGRGTSPLCPACGGHGGTAEPFGVGE